MKYLLLFILLTTGIFPEETKIFEKLKKPLTEAVCKTNRFADCLAYKYIQHYYPNAKNADWYRNTSINHYFDYKVSYQNDREKGIILFSFQSYSDGLEWNYWEDSVIIRIKKPLQLIDSNSITKKIIEKLESEFDEKYDVDRITKTVIRSLQQNQPSPKEYYSIREEIKYKVRANGRNLVFSGNGDLL